MSRTRRRLGVAVVGFGYWGPNIARNVCEAPDLRLVCLCERSAERRREFSRRHPGIPALASLDEALADPAVEAVMIATPPRTHFPLARQAMAAGRHVLVEKPLAMNLAEASALVADAERLGLTLMPGHTFLYSPPVDRIRDLIRDGELGETYFITSTRMNLGLYQAGGVVLDLAPHDLSILLYWLDRPMTHLSAAAQSVFQPGVCETAFLTIGFQGGATANVQISWLAPRKMRQMVVVGSRRMVAYDDTSADEVIRVYDRGMDFDTPGSFGEYRLTYRAGDMVAPRIAAAEPLALELADFARAIRTGEPPRSDAALGLEVVRAIEAAHRSLELDGQPIRLDDVRPLEPDELAARRAPAHATLPAARTANA